MPETAKVLFENDFLLPDSGLALDLACGAGANACFLAEKGLSVQAWDFSDVALAFLDRYAKSNQLQIASKQVDITPDLLPNNTFDVIIISRYLDRRLSHEIMAALKPKGLLFYQTFIQDKPNAVGPNNPDFLLQENELLQMFQALKTVYYQENARIGDLQSGDRNEAYYIGQKITSV